VERDILDDAVTLVEDAQHRDALRHRSHLALPCSRRHDLPHRRRRVLLLGALAAGGERQRNQ